MYDVLEIIESRLYKAIIECNLEAVLAYRFCYNIVAIESKIDKRAALYKVNANVGWEYKIMPTAEYYKFIINY